MLGVGHRCPQSRDSYEFYFESRGHRFSGFPAEDMPSRSSKGALERNLGLLLRCGYLVVGLLRPWQGS
jgi:hypothetical protein